MNLRTGDNDKGFFGIKRRDDFFESFEFIGVWCGSVVMLTAGWIDYQFFGLQSFWIVWRLLFPFYAIFINRLLLRGFFGGRSDFAFLAIGIFVWSMFANFFIVAGPVESTYANGCVQALLAFSILPFGAGLYSMLLAVAVGMPLGFTLYFQGSDGLNERLQGTWIYALIGIVIYLGCSILRKKTSDAQLALQAEIEFQKETILNQSKELAGAEVAFAVARATQAMVHDVRKPFSMIKPTMKILSECKTNDELKEAMAELLPDLDIATRKTEAMLQDVLQIGSQSPPQLENVDPYNLVLQSFKETLWGVDNYDLKLNIEMQSQKMLNCDVFRVGRLLANLFLNAIQAMGAKGQIWVKIRDAEKGLILRIGNAGSHIPAEDLPQIFKSFYSKNKRGGTGLGLAIVEKIAREHGGSVSCVSDVTTEHPNGFVEFWVELPSGGEIGDLREWEKMITFEK